MPVLYNKTKECQVELLDMRNLQSNLLIEAYKVSKKIKLDAEFIRQLKIELEERLINVDGLEDDL